MAPAHSTTTAKVTFSVPPPIGVRAFRDLFADPSTGTDKNYSFEIRDITIENLRGQEPSYTLDSAGFQLLHCPSKYTAFNTDIDIKREYYPESVEIVKQVTGASRVVVFDHTIRRRTPNQPNDRPGARQPANTAHVDQSPAAASVRVHRHLPAEEVPGLLRRRYQIINLWRPISHPALDWPLALCDYRSVASEDTFPVTLMFSDREGETLGVGYNPHQKWKYFYGVTPDEAILIKCADSVRDGSVAVFTPHTAFEDPYTPEGAPPRESIELRALVFYD